MSHTAGVFRRCAVRLPDLCALNLRATLDIGAPDVSYESEPMPLTRIERDPHADHSTQCPICKQARPVGVHRSYVAWSIVFVPIWSSMTQRCCRSCAAKLQFGGIVFSVLFGLLGIPFCWIFTPHFLVRGLNVINFAVQVLRNVYGLLSTYGGRPTRAAQHALVRSPAVATRSGRRPRLRPASSMAHRPRVV
jgi:hypothetical protein